MAQHDGDLAFVGSVPEQYERLMVPLIFAEPAEHLARVVAARAPDDVLETAAGTGVLTRLLAPVVATRLVATDLNEPMVRAGARLLSADNVAWEVADALDLPFPDASFDVVACQFGAMFFPDRVQGFREARRVLRPGGAFVLSVWDRISTSGVADVVTTALCAAAPEAPLDFLARTPHGHHDTDLLRSELVAAGFTEVAVEALDGTSRCTPEIGALAYCLGTPLRAEIEKHPTLDVEQAVRIATEALTAAYGAEEFEAPTRWFELTATG